MFVVGISHENYKENLNTAKKLNSIISRKANISRGILQKSSANANGIYNQDKSADVILIEVGLNISAGSTGNAFNSSRPVTLTKAITISSTNFKKIGI